MPAPAHMNVERYNTFVAKSDEYRQRMSAASGTPMFWVLTKELEDFQNAYQQESLRLKNAGLPY